MSEKKKLKDKQVYSFKIALEQPIWIQKITDKRSLPNAMRLSSIFWIALFFLLFNSIAVLISKTGLPYPFLLPFAVASAYITGVVVGDLRIEGKHFLRFFVDFVIYYVKYGIKANRYYINNGHLHRKIKTVFRKKGDEMWD